MSGFRMDIGKVNTEASTVIKAAPVIVPLPVNLMELEEACLQNDTKVILDILGRDEITPHHLEAIICYTRDLDIFKSLIGTTKITQDIFRILLQQERWDIIDWLLQSESIPLDVDQRATLTILCRKGNLEFLQAFLKKFPDVTVTEEDVMECCYNDSLDVAVLLVRRLTACSQELLSMACQLGQEEFLMEVLEKTPLLNDDHLNTAASYGHEHVVKTLLERLEGTQIKQTTLYTAVIEGRLSIVQLLLTRLNVDPHVFRFAIVSEKNDNHHYEIFHWLLDNHHDARFLCENSTFFSLTGVDPDRILGAFIILLKRGLITPRDLEMRIRSVNTLTDTEEMLMKMDHVTIEM